jgi:Protein of unknown function VcgC/VcgE (DUF2780)
MKALALLLVLPAGLAYGQSSPPASVPPATAPPASAPAAAPAEKTVDKTASPELVGQLVNDLGVTPAQAEGAAGALFGLAKTRLSPADFGKVAGAVPNMDGLLKAAPAAASDAKSTGVDALLGKATTSAGGAVAAASTLSKLGLKPETIAKVAPALIKAVQSKGGAEVGSLLAGALK